MIFLGTLQDGLLNRKIVVYLFSFVFIQLVVIITVFEFMRKPWDGVENELEKAMEFYNNKLLDDSISCMTMMREDE